jgi:hypothetical protein
MPLAFDHPVASMKAVGKLPWYYQCLVMGLVRRAAMHDNLDFYWTMRFAPRAWAQFFIEFRTRGDRSPRYVFIGELIEDPEGVWEPPVVAPAVAPPAPLDAPSAASSAAVAGTLLGFLAAALAAESAATGSVKKIAWWKGKRVSSGSPRAIGGSLRGAKRGSGYGAVAFARSRARRGVAGYRGRG